MKRSWLVMAVFLPLALGCGSGVSSGTKTVEGSLDTSKEVVLGLRIKPNDAFTSHMVSESSAGGQTVKLTITQEQKVDKVDGDKYHMSSTVKEMLVEGSGPQVEALRQGAESQKGKITTMVMDDRSRIVSSNDPSVQEMNLPSLPEEAIKAGSTWEGTFEAMMIKGKMKNRAEGVQRVSGRDAMKVVTTMTSDDGSVSGTTTSWFDIETGQTILSDSTTTIKMMGQEVTSKTHLELR